MSSRRNSGSSLPDLHKYYEESQRPLAILAYLTPFALLYEVGMTLFHNKVVASSLLQRFVGMFDVNGRGVPFALLVVTLLTWHLVKKDKWRVRFATLGGMLIESLLLALPVIAISVICRRSIPLYTLESRSSLAALWAVSMGAGVYEELLFRFYGCGILRFLFEFLLRIKPPVSTVLIIIVSAVLFSLYHYLGTERFSAFTFFFRALAGAYFTGLFLYRGLGVTAGAHAIYDIIVVTVV